MALSSLFIMGNSHAQLPLEIFWGTDQYIHSTSTNQLNHRQNYLRYQIHHEQIWQAKKPHSNDRIKYQQQTLSLVISPDISKHANITLQLSQHYTSFIASQQTTDWHGEARHANNNPQAGVLIQARYAFVGLFYNQQEQMAEIGLRFNSKNSVFIKHKNTQSQWRNDFELNPNTPDEYYKIKFPLHTDIRLFGGGWTFSHNTLSLNSEALLSEHRTNHSQSHKLNWQLSIGHRLEFQTEHFQYAADNQAISIDKKIQGRWNAINQYQANTLAWTIDSNTAAHQFYLKHNQWQLDLEGNYNARALVNHWASILVGGGRFKFSQHTQFVAVGINSTNPTRQPKGRLWAYGIALGQLKFTSDGGHIVDQYPIGTLLNTPLTFGDRKIDVALLSITTGYRWPQFEWRYRYAQIVPLREDNDESDQAKPSSNQRKQASPSNWAEHLKRLPDGSRHTLEIRYLF